MRGKQPNMPGILKGFNPYQGCGTPVFSFPNCDSGVIRIKPRRGLFNKSVCDPGVLSTIKFDKGLIILIVRFL